MTMFRYDPDDARHEIKFVLRETDRHDMLHWLKLHRAGFSKLYPPRQVNNVYFDSFGLDACHDNLSGISKRTKLRLRWYGDIDRFEASTLEIKRRRNLYGWKDSFKIPGAFDLNEATWRQVRQHVRDALPAPARVVLDANPQPVIVNAYQRSYHMSHDGKVRVTLDTNLRALDQRFKSRPNVDRFSPLERVLVVEFKFSPDDRDAARSYMATMPVRVSKSSKYVGGVLAVTEN